MAKLNIFTYTSYRRFLSDWLKENNFSYRDFVARHKNVISFIALAKLLSKGRAGTKERADYRISPEALARLGRAIRLSDEELMYLVFLRLENDADALQGPHGGAYRHVMKRALDLQLMLPSNKNDALSYNANAKYNEKSLLIIEIVNILPIKQQAKIIEEILLQSKIYASRQTGRPGVKNLNSLLRELGRFKDMGAP